MNYILPFFARKTKSENNISCQTIVQVESICELLRLFCSVQLYQDSENYTRMESFVEVVLSEMESRFKDIFSDELYMAARFLDPREKLK